SQEFSISSIKGGEFDYKAGVFLYESETEIDSRTGWGTDAGAWFATNAQYNLLDRNAGINRGAGLALLKDSLNDLFKDGNTWVTAKSNAVFGQADWHWSEAATFSAGLRVGTEDRSTEDDVPLASNGSGGLLNPDVVRGLNLGGFASTTNGTLGKQIKNPDGTTSIVNNNTPEQLSVADKVANKYYGATITGVPGQAYNSLTAAQKAQVGAAKGVRATQLGQIYRNVISYYDDTLYTANLSQNYKFNDQVTGYVTWQHGEKSGTAFNINGVPTGVKPEKTNAFEVGIKTFLLDETLTFNADIFVADLTNYQQSVRLVDEFATEVAIADLPPTATDAEKNAAIVYVTAQGNVPEIRTQGLEFDANYNGIDNLTLRISGAYTDAHYVDFKNVPKPEELAYLPEPYIDRSGQTIPGASEWTVNAGAEYLYPLNWANVRSSVNAAYISTYNIGDTYSTYGDLPSYVITDFSIGLASKNGEYDLSLVVKNVFDENPHEVGWTSYQPFLHRRWVGAVFSAHF
ncbi:MAG TPA: TonB-dependent receptor, partial [Cellvibrio sp.]